MNMHASEMVAVLGSVDPDVTAAGDVSSGWISAANFYAFMAVVLGGTLGVSSSVTAKIEKATAAAGTGATDLTGATITALTGSGADSDKQAVISFRQDQLGHIAGVPYTHFRLTVTAGDDGSSPTGTTSDLGALVLGVFPRVAPASGYDASTVDSVTNV
jgi:hypothetical protein